MELRLKTFLIVLASAAVLAAGGCVTSTPTPLPTPTSALTIPCLQEDAARSKLDPILAHLLAMKNQPADTWYDPWRSVLELPQVVVGVRTDRNLTADELAAVSAKTGVTLGKTREWSDGTVSYGATVAWDRICPLLNLPMVVGMSTSNPVKPQSP